MLLGCVESSKIFLASSGPAPLYFPLPRALHCLCPSLAISFVCRLKIHLCHSPYPFPFLFLLVHRTTAGSSCALYDTQSYPCPFIVQRYDYKDHHVPRTTRKATLALSLCSGTTTRITLPCTTHKAGWSCCTSRATHQMLST